MNTHTQKHLKIWLTPTVVLVVLSSLFITRTVVARIVINTIDPVGIVADKGQVTVTGPTAVTTGERTELRVTVTQRSTGAVAEGVIFFTGSDQTNQWEITAVAEGWATFEVGPATVVALARSSINGQVTDSPVAGKRHAHPSHLALLAIGKSCRLDPI